MSLSRTCLLFPFFNTILQEWLFRLVIIWYSRCLTDNFYVKLSMSLFPIRKKDLFFLLGFGERQSAALNSTAQHVISWKLDVNLGTECITLGYISIIRPCTHDRLSRLQSAVNLNLRSLWANSWKFLIYQKKNHLKTSQEIWSHKYLK